jgi:membrane-bound lytic murein transglycosylase B
MMLPMPSMYRLPTLALALAAALFAAPAAEARSKPRPAPPDGPSYAGRDDAMRFADAVAERHGLDREAVRAAIAGARQQPRVQQFIMPPPAGTAKNWAAYRARFVEPVRLRAGVAFWRAHAELLQRAEAETGVPPEIVAGILGVETLWGQQTGGFRVIDALATLAFDFPAGRRDRSAFFRDELEALIVLAAREKLDPAEFRGSYAGAIGWPQFMPSSILKYAVDYDGDGQVDLRGSVADAIGSVAHYLKAFQWQRGMPTHYEVAVPVEVADRAVLLAPDILPSFTPAQFAERGAVLDAAGQRHEGPLALVELQNGEAAPSYVAGTANFYAITRYNWSSYYAMAVIELGRTVARIVSETRP